jgi:hypothetical protein
MAPDCARWLVRAPVVFLIWQVLEAELAALQCTRRLYYGVFAFGG